MDKTICGHERDVLIWALTDPDPLNSAEREKRVIVPIGGPIDFSQCVATPKQRAAVCVHDPAKLAEMLAARGRELGLAFWHGPNEPREPSPTDHVLYVIDGVIRLYSPLSPKAWQRQYALPQARAILLQWLQLPDGAREEAERALRGAA